MGVLLVPQPHTGSKQEQCSEFVSLGPVYRRVDMHRTYIDLDNIEIYPGLIFTQIEIIYITTPSILYELHPS